MKKQNDKIKELEQQIIDLKIQQHTKGYIHIPFSWKRLGLFALTLLSAGLAYVNLILILFIGKLFKVWTLIGSKTPEKEFHNFFQLIILYPLIGEYLLIGLTMICFCAMVKGGFVKLKKYDDDEGLIFCLTVGLIGGLIFGLIIGLIFGLIGGLIFGLIIGLIFGLIFGLNDEFD